MILEATAMKTETEPKPPPLDGLQPRFLHSISGRLVAGLVIALVVSGGLLVTMALWLGQQSVKAEQEQAAARLVQVFEASLHTSMLQRDLPSLQRTLQVLGQAPGIAQARLLNVQGDVRFASRAAALGGRIPLACQQPDCADATLQNHWVDTAQGIALQVRYPILNRSQCAQCHGEPDVHPVNGVLLIDFAVVPTGLGGSRQALLLGLGLAALLLFGAIMAWAMRRVVTQPLQHMADVSQRLAAGDFDVRVLTSSDDEIGRVGQQFNVMADQVAQTVARLQTQQQFLQDLVNAVPDPLLVIGPDWQIRLANTAYARLIGHDAQTPVRGCCYKVGRGANEPCPSTMLTCPVLQARENQTLRTVMALRHRDGSDLPVEIDAAQLRFNGEMLTVEILRPLNEAIRYSQEQRLSTIGLLANGVAHEIHNPLASIRLALQASLRGLAQGDMDSAELVHYLKLVDSQIDRCVATTERLMQMSHPPGDALVPVQLVTAIDDTVILLGEEARMRQVEIHFEHPEHPIWIQGDNAELRQVFVNLLHNAMHAMKQGGGVRVEIETSNASLVLIRVSDTGAGIPPENLSRIFLPFFSRRADGQAGMGLGLAVCKSIIDRCGGTIAVASELGKNTVFTITLPLALGVSS
jgi:signal transduction histidine kinase